MAEPRRISVRLARGRGEALAAYAVIKENAEMLGFVMRETILERERARELLVALLGGEVVGCVNFHVRRDRVAVIYEIAAARAAAGSGVGSALVAWMRANLPPRAVAIVLKCTADNVGAHAFYRRAGFRQVGAEPGRRRALTLWRAELGGSFAGRGAP